MKNKWLKKGVFLCLICLVFFLHFSPLKINAASNAAPTIAKKIVCYECKYDTQITLKNMGNGKITSIKSSKPSIVNVDRVGKDNFYYMAYEAGKSQITIKVKKNKKTYTLKTNVEVKVAQPLKYLKVDGKNIYSTKEKGFFGVIDKKKKHKISWKLQKGWKLVSAKYCNQGAIFSPYEARTVKNGSYIPHSISGEMFLLCVKDSKGIEYTISLHLHKG